MYPDYIGTGKIVLGKSTTGAERSYKGNLLELRIWNVSRTKAQIGENLKTTLTGREVGIMGNWRMDEAEGAQIKDFIRSRHGNIYGATWQITPGGKSFDFNGTSNYLSVSSSNVALRKEQDFTIEFWLKSNQSGAATVLSNGRGDGTDATSDISWSIEKTSGNSLIVKHQAQSYVLAEDGLFDGKWHHFAMVLQRNSGLSSYVDGNLKKSYLPDAFGEFSGPLISLAASTWISGISSNYDSFFNGSLDEVRFWKLARTQELIKRDKVNRLKGNEPGLAMYIPFETYVMDPSGATVTASLLDIADNTHIASGPNLTAFSDQTPTIKLPREVKSVAFNYALNNDKIIITPVEESKYIENVTLDITVDGIKDLNGNSMQSPKTWIAYVNKNQVKWLEQDFTLTKLLGEAKSFDAKIINSGGALKTFSIGNMPAWLSADAPSGVISPNSYKMVHFTIDENVNIGDYEEDLSLVTDFGYDDKLTVNLKVSASAPKWDVEAAGFQYNQGIIGQVKIDGVISTSADDKVAAFVGNECRGVGSLKYYPDYDKYFVALDIFSNSMTPEIITFKVWNAAQGKEHTDVTPSITFKSDDVLGSFATPVFFETTDKLNRALPLKAGWNWISLNET